MDFGKPYAVIGASIAGLSAALSLLKSGKRVEIYEAQSPFSPKSRTLIVTSRFSRFFDSDHDLILNRISTYELISCSSSIRIPLEKPDFVLDRASLLKALLRRTEGHGGKVFFGHRVLGINEESEVVVEVEKDLGRKISVSAQGVVGADGRFSVVRNAMGIDGIEYVGISQALVYLPEDCKQDTVRVWFDTRRTRFFFWLIPTSERKAAVGVIAEAPRESRELLLEFIKSEGFDLLEWEEDAHVPVFKPGITFKSSSKRVILAGDAASQVKMTTVGGVVTGMWGGWASGEFLSGKDRAKRQIFSLKKELTAHWLLRNVLDTFNDHDYDTLFRLMNRWTLRILSRKTRDEFSKSMWMLIFSQPGWASLALKKLSSIVFGRRNRTWK